MDYLNQVKQTIDLIDMGAIQNFIHILNYTRQNNGKIYIFGNGGSAATASHFSVDFNKNIDFSPEPNFHFICLNDNIPTITALANDCGYEHIFDYQLKNILKPEDIVIGISGSGNSSNVLNGLLEAKEQGCLAISITGFNGGRAKEISDFYLHININNMQIVEDIHMILNHMICTMLKESINGSKENFIC